jgi:hypothetical protein
MIEKILRERVTGSFGISVGTSHVFEPLFGHDNSVYDGNREYSRLNPNDYEFFYLNVYTLIRNIIASTETKLFETIMSLNPTSFKEVILTELSAIETIFKNNTSCKLVLYIPDYYKANIDIYNANRKQNKKIRTFLKTIDIIKSCKKDLISNVDNYVDDLKLPRGKASLINTHISLDLLNKKYIKNLVLIESVTSKIVQPIEFNKKYPDSKLYMKNRLPFNDYILRLVGDNFLLDQFFKGEHKIDSSRALIGEVSNKYKWSPITTEDKVVMNIKQIQDLRDMYNIIKTRIIYK